MGGIGSGREAASFLPRDYVDNTASIGVADLRDNGVLPSGGPARWEQRSAGQTLHVVAYVLDGKAVITVAHAGPGGMPRVVEATVALSFSDCRFGGTRPWMLCNGVEGAAPCGRRVEALFLTAAGLMCRHCGHVSYRSSHAESWMSPLTRVRKIIISLGGSGDLTEDFPPRPKGMHDVKYRQLHREVCRLLCMPQPGAAGGLPPRQHVRVQKAGKQQKAGKGRDPGQRPAPEPPGPGDGASIV